MNISDWFSIAVSDSNQATRRCSSAALRCQLKKLTGVACRAKFCTTQNLDIAAACREFQTKADMCLCL